MATLQVMAAAAHVVRLNGVEYYAEPLRARDWADFIAWVGDEYVAAHRRAHTGDETAVAAAAVDAAVGRAVLFTTGSPEVQAMANTPLGSLRLLWLGLRHRHPELTLEMLDDMLRADARGATAAADAFNAANTTAGGPADPKATKAAVQ